MAETRSRSMQPPAEPSSRARPGGAAGFSVLEVLVALVVAGLALTAVAGVFGTGLDAHRVRADAAAALTFAEGRLAMAGSAEPLRAGRTGGEFGDRFRWQLSVSPYEDRQDESPSRFARPHLAVQLYRIEVVVAWSERARRRQVTLATLRLGAPQ